MPTISGTILEFNNTVEEVAYIYQRQDKRPISVSINGTVLQPIAADTYQIPAGLVDVRIDGDFYMGYEECLANIGTFRVKQMDSDIDDYSNMFHSCTSMFSFDAESVGVLKAHNYSLMFKGCTDLESVNMAFFILPTDGQEINLGGMFEDCCWLQSIDLSNLDTSNVVDMSWMFSCCCELTVLDVSNFNTSRVTNMSGMFSYCCFVAELDVSNFDTSQVTDMSFMFYCCCEIATLDLRNFNTSKVTDMIGMLEDCNYLTNVNLSSFDTSQVTSMAQMFRGCFALESLDISNFDVSKVKCMENMFNSLYEITTLDLSNFNTASLDCMDNMFRDCKKLISLDLSSFDTSQVTMIRSLVYGCSNLKYLNLSSFDTSNVKNMNYMFKNCVSLVSIDVSHFNTQNVKYFNNMFEGCTGLTSIDVSHFERSPEKLDTDHMFFNCTNLVELFLPRNFTVLGTNFAQNCNKLELISNKAIASQEILVDAFTVAPTAPIKIYGYSTNTNFKNALVDNTKFEWNDYFPNAPIQVLDDRYTVDAPGSKRSILYSPSSILPVSNATDKYYARIAVKLMRYESGEPMVTLGCDGKTSHVTVCNIKNLPLNTEQICSVIVDTKTEWLNKPVYFKIGTMDALGAKYEFTQPILINLTQLFGAGKEPSLTECNTMFGDMQEAGFYSSQAIVSNNQENYAFSYLDSVIKLSSIEDIADNLLINSDYTGTFINKICTKKLTLTSAIEKSAVNGATRMRFAGNINNAKTNAKGIADKVFFNNSDIPEKEYLKLDGSNIYYYLLSSDTRSLKDVMDYLNALDITVAYEIDEPIINNINKTTTPTIPMGKSNILGFDKTLHPGYVSITAPVDRITELDNKIKALESSIVKLSTIATNL